MIETDSVTKLSGRRRGKGRQRGSEGGRERELKRIRSWEKFKWHTIFHIFLLFFTWLFSSLTLFVAFHDCIWQLTLEIDNHFQVDENMLTFNIENTFYTLVFIGLVSFCLLLVSFLWINSIYMIFFLFSLLLVLIR